jgi:hypothetical protein
VRDVDLTHTIHAALARLAERVLDRFDTPPAPRVVALAPEIARDDTDPQLRKVFALAANAGWITLAGACIVAIPVIAIPVKLLLGEAAGHLVATACLAGAMFCCAGIANVLWRMYWYVPQARRRARKDGVDSKRFATSMRRAMPRNSSLIFQTAVAILTLIVAL